MLYWVHWIDKIDFWKYMEQINKNYKSWSCTSFRVSSNFIRFFFSPLSNTFEELRSDFGDFATLFWYHRYVISEFLCPFVVKTIDLLHWTNITNWRSSFDPFLTILSDFDSFNQYCCWFLIRFYKHLHEIYFCVRVTVTTVWPIYNHRIDSREC